MLSLKIAGRPVDLPNDFSITMNLKSPLFNEVGSYSYPFRLPVTPANATIMNFGHRPENTGNLYLQRSSEFFWNGLSLFSGTSRLSQLNKRSYEGSVLDGTGDFNYQIKNNYLHQYDFGEQTFATENAAFAWINGCANQVYPDRPCAFPEIYNDLYFEGGQTEPEMLSFNFYSRINDLIHPLSTSGLRTPVVPMLYLRYVLDKLITGMGYKLDDQFFTSNAAFNKIVLFNAVTCNNETEGLFPYWVTHLYYNYHIPRIKLSDFFTGLENYFNIRFFPNQVTRTIRIVPLNDILADTGYRDFSRNVMSFETAVEDKINGFKLKMELDGDDTAFESQNTYEEDFIKNFKGAVEKVSELPPWPNCEPLEIRYVIATDRYYKMLNKAWVLIDISVQGLKTQYLVGDFSTEISTGFSTLIMGGDSSTCNCKNQAINYTQISPRLLFSLYGSYDGHMQVQGYNFNPDFGSLFYAGPTGIYNLLYRDWLNWRMAAKLVKITRQMSFQELKEFDFEKKIMAGGLKYLVRSVQITLKTDRIMPAVLECYTCN